MFSIQGILHLVPLCYFSRRLSFSCAGLILVLILSIIVQLAKECSSQDRVADEYLLAGVHIRAYCILAILEGVRRADLLQSYHQSRTAII